MSAQFAGTLARACTFGACALFATIFMPSAEAQQRLSPVAVVALEETEHARADVLDERARALYSTPSKFREAAQLHYRAALIRGNGPQAAASLRSAALAFSAAKRGSLATELMVKSAELSAMSGRVEESANAYIDAALLAVAEQRVDKVPVLLSRMHTVLSSPLLPEARRSKILERIQGDDRIAE
jgi:hypothetical protein